MTDDLTARCVEALLMACPEYRGSATRLDGADFPPDARLVTVDDAAAAIARVIDATIDACEDATGEGLADEAPGIIRAALAAAREGER